ncbi:MAG: queuosine precursor transporter [Firmicutes bacterium]|nr:queuosine precursor transporter [Bacillota bacterium]
MPKKRLLFLTSLFITSLLIANITAVKLVQIGGLIVPAAVFVFPITFLVTDVVCEVWGKKQATELVWLGFFMNIVLMGYLQLGRVLPPAPVWPDQKAYEAIFGAVPRIVLASMCAYIISQTHDVWAFDYWRRLTRGKHLWLRNNLSTMASQLMDTVVFITIGFAGTVPRGALIGMIFSQYMVKLVLALIDTPFCYLVVNWARKERGTNVIQAEEN